MNEEIKNDIKEIKADLNEVKLDLREHMTRTKASEKRIEIMEKSVDQQRDHNEKIVDLILKSGDKQAMRLNQQLKIALGVFAALATLVTALAYLFGRSNPVVNTIPALPPMEQTK